MLHTEVATAIREFAAVSHPKPEQLEAIIQGWDEAFARFYIPLERQLDEFLDLMRRRVQSGVISVIAPQFPGQDDALSIANAL